MARALERPWFRANVEGAEILTWEGWLTFAVLGLALAAIWRVAAALPDLQRFGLSAALIIVSGWLMRLRSIDAEDGDEEIRKPWTSWLPMAIAIAFLVGLNLLPRLDESERIALSGMGMLPAAVAQFLIERRAARR